MLEKETRITTFGGTDYFKIPKDVRQDSAFPFKGEDALHISIRGDAIIITGKEVARDDTPTD